MEVLCGDVHPIFINRGEYLETSSFYQKKNGWRDLGVSVQWNAAQGFKNKVLTARRARAKLKGIMMNEIRHT